MMPDWHMDIPFLVLVLIVPKNIKTSSANSICHLIYWSMRSTALRSSLAFGLRKRITVESTWA